MTRRLGWLVAAAVLASCGGRTRPRERSHTEPTPTTVAPSASAVEVPPSPSVPVGAVVLDAADPKSPCVFGYRGAVVDIGGSSDGADLGTLMRPAPVEIVEREGASWAAVRGKSLAVSFYVVLPADMTAEGPAGATPYVELRVRAGAARSLALSLNGHALGSAVVPRGEARTIVLKGSAAQPVPGANELTVHFAGIAKGSTDPSAELAWAHFGVGDPDPLYAAPTRRDTLVSRTFAGQPGRALSLRGPGFARCEGWLPAGGVIESRALLEGTGSADAEVRVVRDRVPPTVVGTLHLDAADAAGGRLHTWPLGDVGTHGTLGAVELSVVRASKGSRVIFGEPRVRAPAEPVRAPSTAPAAAAKGVVLVVMSQLGLRSLAAYGGPLPTPEVSALASSGVVFESNLSSTGIASGSVGSMLTGLGARDLGLIDGDSRLPREVTTIADAVRQAGIASAFFSANPLTSPAFGFDRGWTHYEAHGPTDDVPAPRVFDAAVAWLDEHRKAPFLVVIHARGGHPPWDVPLERIKALPPENYTGGLEARHAGELLGKSLRAPGSYRFDDADRARGWALYGAAMEAEDAGLGRLMTLLRTTGLYDDTTVIVTADVGVNDAARVPFAESESLDEVALSTPLVVRFAHDAGKGAHVTAPTGGTDVARTVLAAFGLPSPATFGGRDLSDLVRNGPPAAPPSTLAVDRDRFALVWGSFVSSGLRDRETKLCDLSLEPGCVTDVRASYPLASRLLHAALYRRLVSAKPAFAREAAPLDIATQAALKAWGR